MSQRICTLCGAVFLGWTGHEKYCEACRQKWRDEAAERRRAREQAGKPNKTRRARLAFLRDFIPRLEAQLEERRKEANELAGMLKPQDRGKA